MAEPPAAEDVAVETAIYAYPLVLMEITRRVSTNVDGSQDAIRRTLLIAEQAGIRALLTHPIDPNAGAFSRRFGFASSPVREGQLLLLLKDARRVL